MSYTLGMAAPAAGLSKSTIHRTIKAGRISATRAEAGSYAIDPAELHRVFPAAQKVTRSGNDCVIQDATPSEQSEIALRYARLEAEIVASLQVNAVLRQQLLETRLDRERWAPAGATAIDSARGSSNGVEDTSTAPRFRGAAHRPRVRHAISDTCTTNIRQRDIIGKSSILSGRARS
jgi:hypothetical protein